MYHGIIVDKSLKSPALIRSLKVIGQKKSSNDNWMLYKIEIEDNELENAIKMLQDEMIEGNYYFHFYKNSELIICFKNKVFKVTPEKSSWKEAVEYGRSLGIPELQLDFYPSKLEEETY